MPSPRRLVTLDALRGVAALSIIVFHLRPPFNPGQWMSHAYLAVDLFFLLSGFVLDKNYTLSLQSGKITVRTFLLMRLIRLYPLLFLGALLSIIVQIIGNYLRINYYDFGHFFRSIASILSCLPLDWQSGTFLFDLNTPVWSLFFEGILSVSFAFFAPARVRTLAALVALSAVLFAIAIAHYGSASVGPEWSDMLGGFPRAFFSFYLGVLMSRRLSAEPRLPSFVALLAPGCLIAILVVSPGDHYIPAWDALCVFFLLPALLVVSARTEPKQFSKIFGFLGLISYCVYIIHYPIRRAFEKGIPLVFGTLPESYYILTAILMLGFIIILSWFVLVAYDLPLRAYLSAKLLYRSTDADKDLWRSASSRLEPSP